MAFVDGHIERGGVEQYFPNADAFCLQEVWQVSIALQSYAQDYDQTYPMAGSDEAYRASLYPYIKTDRIWSCPSTNVAYGLASSFRGHTLVEYSAEELSTTAVAYDVLTHRSGNSSVTYLDGHAVQTGPRGTSTLPGPVLPRPPAEVSVSRLKELSVAMLEYSQDYDNRLPPMKDIPTLRTAILPYVFDKDPTYFDPPTGGNPFVLNATLGGTLQSMYPSPSEVVWIKDVNSYRGRLIAKGYLDGHVKRVAP